MAEQRLHPYWRQVALGGGTGAAERNAKSRQARMAIVVAAGDQFATRGYASTSLSAIAQGCGMTKGALYFHFQSKQQLAEAVVAEMLTRWAALRARVADRRLDPLRALIAEVDEVIEASTRDPVLRGGILLARDRDAVATGAHAHFDFGQQATVEHLTRAVAAGDLRPEIQPEVVARQIVALLTGHRTLTAVGIGAPTVAEAMEEAWSVLLPAIASTQWLRAGGTSTPQPDEGGMSAS